MTDLSLPAKRLLLVDGNSIINRSYFAMAGRSSLTAPDGTPTGALNTYLNTLWKYLDELKPTHICTLFDVREKTFRHEMYDGYKAKRKGMPDELAIQMPLLKEALDALGLPRYELPGYEADDLIGTLAAQGEAAGFSVYILSGDKDDFQLIDNNTVVIMPATKAGKTTTEIYDAKALLERYKTTPEEFITLKAIMGDPSDNIPGVRGIGEKGAIDLVSRFGNLDRIYQHIDELSAGLQKKLLEDREMAYLSYDLAKINCQAPISFTVDQLTLLPQNQSELLQFFTRLGLRSQIKKWQLDQGEESLALGEEGTEDQWVPPLGLFDQLSTFEATLREASEKKAKNFVLAMEILQRADGTLYILMAFSKENYFVFTAEEFSTAQKIIETVLAPENQPESLVVGYQIKNRFRALEPGLTFKSCFDIEIAGYVLNQISGSAPSFETLYEQSTKEAFPLWAKESTGNKSVALEQSIDSLLEAESGEADRNEDFKAAAQRLFLYRQIAKAQRKEISALAIDYLLYQIEMPLVLNLDRMERKGVLIDQFTLDHLHQQFTQEIERLSLSIYEKSGREFNILSPKQLGQILFEDLGLPSGRKNSSGGYSTDVDELNRLHDSHPIVGEILEYRQLSKLDSTFILGLKKVIKPDGRVRSNFAQVMTSTGRLSSSDPNLQNIPIRSDSGSLIRKAFIAPENYVLLDADYSQIELRLLAHLSGDENMIQAFLQEEDIHTTTATRIFSVTPEQVEPSMRAAAKTVNFSIVYGISDFGLAQDLGISLKEAHHYITHYYDQYPRIRSYLDSLKQMAYDKGYVETMFGRRRYVTELKSPNRNLRNFGERAAMNTPVQGSAADIIKIAMNRISYFLEEAGLDARLILQVHDELIVECHQSQIEEASKLLKEAMEGAIDLSVPLIAEVNVGQNWFQCKE